MSLGLGQHRRRSIRLQKRDYADPGAYYVTLCVHDRENLFGDVTDGVMYLNDAGRATESFWKEIPRHFPRATLDEFVIMPNHIHGIIWIVDNMRSVLDMNRGDGAGANCGHVGANNHSPLQPPHPASKNTEQMRQRPRGTSKTIGSMVRGFKIAATRWMRSNGRVVPVWQRNYHEHIIRNERSLERIRAYIRANPVNWQRDRNNPGRRV
jgi:putative transposase